MPGMLKGVLLAAAASLMCSAVGGVAAEQWAMGGVDRFYFNSPISTPDRPMPPTTDGANAAPEPSPAGYPAPPPEKFPPAATAPERTRVADLDDDRWQREIDADNRRWKSRMDAEVRREQRLVEQSRLDDDLAERPQIENGAWSGGSDYRDGWQPPMGPSLPPGPSSNDDDSA